MHFLTYIAGRLNDSMLQSVATPPSGHTQSVATPPSGQVEVSKKRSADDSPTSLPISDARTARAATRASVVAGNFNQRATPPNTSQRDARAASHPFAGINEHCATSLLSLSFFQVYRFLQHPRQQSSLLQSRTLLVRRLPNRQWRVTPKTVLRHPIHLNGMLVRLIATWLVSMSIVLRHFSQFHSFRYTGSSSIPGNKRYC